MRSAAETASFLFFSPVALAHRPGKPQVACALHMSSPAESNVVVLDVSSESVAVWSRAGGRWNWRGFGTRLALARRGTTLGRNAIPQESAELLRAEWRKKSWNKLHGMESCKRKEMVPSGRDVHSLSIQAMNLCPCCVMVPPAAVGCQHGSLSCACALL